MMLRLKRINKKDFDNYIYNNNNSSHFMQTSAWGEFQKVIDHITPHYLALVNENNEIYAATLLLEKHLEMNYSSFYAPRGFIIDYKNKNLLNFMTKKLTEYAKKRKAISIRINPCVIYRQYNYKSEKITKNSALDIINNLREIGYKKQQTTKLLEYSYKIDLTKSLEEIENHFLENAKEKININKKYNIEISVGTQKDLEELFILSPTLDRNYYETLYEIFSQNENTKVTIFLGKLNITKSIKGLERDLKRTNDQISILPIDNLSKDAKIKLQNLRKQKEEINKDIELLKNYKLEYGNYIIMSANLVMEHQNKAWILCESNNHVLKETSLSHNIYYEYIKYYKERNFIEIDQLCPINSLPDTNKIKKEFGGYFVEFIGEWLYITNKCAYILLKKVLPLFNKIKNKLKKEN